MMILKRMKFSFLLTILSLPVLSQVTFVTVPKVSLPQTPQELAKGDFNNDGKQDFVSVNFNALANQQLTILLNTGVGTFSGANKKNFAAATNAIDVAVGDFNEDGKLDVVSCSQSNSNFSLMLGDGAGNLAAPVNVAAGNLPQGIAVGDMNKDNHLDVLVSNRGTPAQLFIYLGNGAGGFSSPTIINISNLIDVAVADFNGDANMDFAVSFGTASTSVQPWFGNGSGTSYTAGTLVTGFGLGDDILAVNLDNDSDIDIVASSGYTLNNGTGAFGARILLTQTGSEYTVADINKDGNPDIIANDNNQNTANVRLLLGDGLGVFTLLAKFETNGLFTGVEVADTNNDSNLDIVGIGTWGGVAYADVLLGDGAGHFSNAPSKYPSLTDPRDLAKGDFNGDGNIDIALCHSIGNVVSVYLGLGNGKFSKTATNHATGSAPYQIITIDFNKDNRLDLVTFNFSSSNITVLAGDGTGSFNLHANYPVTSLASGRLATADFNNDSNPDLVVSGYSSKVINFLSGTGSGFNPAVTIPTSSDVEEIKAADFNGDGKMDIVANFPNLNRFVIFNGNGAGGFTESTTQYQHKGSFFLVEDLNNDNKPDIIAFEIGAFNDFFVNDGAGNFTGSGISVSLGGFPWGYADMNNDGFKDLVVGAQNYNSSEPGQILVFKGTATGITSTILIDKDYSGGNRLVLHDVNNDGKMDIISTSFNIYEDYLGVLINNTTATGCPSITTQPIDQAGCVGQGISLNVGVTGTAPLTYQWKKGASNIGGATSSTFSIASLTASDAGLYSCSVSNACGSVTSNSVSVVVNSIPSAPTSSGTSGCSPSVATLTASGGTNGQYRWYTVPSGGTAIPGQTNASYTTSSLATTTTYYVSVNNGTCESNRTPVTATITGACAQPPVINTQSLATQIGGIITINLVPLITTSNNNLDVNSIQIVTPPTSGASASISNGVLTINYGSTSFAGTEKITIKACDSNGNCTTQDFQIEVAGDIIIYNALSPNGANPTFILEFITSFPETKNNTVTIFDRWQNEVWRGTNYDNSSVVFTGKSDSGADLPTGTYFYRIDFSSGRKSRTGFISLKR